MTKEQINIHRFVQINTDAVIECLTSAFRGERDAFDKYRDEMRRHTLTSCGQCGVRTLKSDLTEVNDALLCEDCQ